MHCSYAERERLDDPKFIGLPQWLANGTKDEPPMEARLAVSISEAAAYSLVDFADEYHFGDAESFGWDIWRQHGGPGGAGRDIFETLFIWSGRAPRTDNWRQEVDRLWNSFNRPIMHMDRLLIDAADEISHFGWNPPSDVASSIEALRDMCSARRRDRYRREEEQEQAYMLKLEHESLQLERLFNAAQEVVRRKPDLLPLDSFSDIARKKLEALVSAPFAPHNHMRAFIDLVHECLEAQIWKTEMEELPALVELNSRMFEEKVRRAMRPPGGSFVLNGKTNNPEPGHPENVETLLVLNRFSMQYNAWAKRFEFCHDGGPVRPLTDSVLDDLMTMAAGNPIEFRPSKEFFYRTIGTLCRQNTYDPLLERLDALAAKWDGTLRLNDWLTHACGVPHDAYHTAVGRNLIGGMVRRARHAGCQHDECVLFISPRQGTGKSTLTKILALEEDWHTQSVKLGGRPQDTIPQMTGKWVVELSELAGMRKTDVEDLKTFISATSDNVTLKYDKFATDQPRRCIFIGTSNDTTPLRDRTGGRRFLPVHVQGEVNLEWLRNNVEQLIGEAAVREAAGELFGIPREVWSEAAKHQQAAHLKPEYEMVLEEWLAPSGLPTFVTAADLSEVVREAAGRPVNVSEYRDLVRRLGFESAQKKVDGRNVNVWCRGEVKGAMRLIPKTPYYQQRGVRLSMAVDEGESRPVTTVAAPPY